MQQHRRPEEELSDLSNVIPEAVVRASSSAAVEPVTSIDDVVKEASENTSLHQAFQEQVVHAVRDRVRNDPDFVADKYPNAEKFFGKKKKNKKKKKKKKKNNGSKMW